MAGSCGRNRSIKQARFIQMRTSIVKSISMTFFPKYKHSINGIYICIMWIYIILIEFYIPWRCLC
jgi:hypothetical protein